MARKPSPASSLNVLFVGNSFTARNDLPGMLAALAKSAGLHLDHHLISVGGASLRTHWNKGDAAKAIESGGFDYVVLQEQSTLPIKNPTRFQENVRLFDPAIRDAGAKPALYLTWARRRAPDTQRQLTDAYQSIAKETRATLIPAGVAWERFLAKYEAPVLHDKDGSHPTPAGTYLAACVFFGVLFRRSPVDLDTNVEGLAPPDRKRLQTVAWSAID